jgi:hypothetical protein
MKSWHRGLKQVQCLRENTLNVGDICIHQLLIMCIDVRKTDNSAFGRRQVARGGQFG